MPKPKFDYEGDEFYKEIERLAFRGMLDSEISYALSDKFGVDLNPATFSNMKNGKYGSWNKEQNVKYSERIRQCLERGRSGINALVRGKYLKMAIGGGVVKGKTVTKRHVVVNGQQTDNLIVETRETEQELPPNAQALSTWLYQNDKEWRKKCLLKKEEEEADKLPFDKKKGVSISKWIEHEMESNNEEEE